MNNKDIQNQPRAREGRGGEERNLTEDIKAFEHVH
jgi:hypothetical protein